MRLDHGAHCRRIGCTWDTYVELACYIVGMKRKESIEAVNAQYVCAFRPEPEGGYTVRCHAFPEIVTYGATLDDARRNAREAIELCIEVYRDKGWSLPKSDPDPRKTIKEMVPVKLARA
jgi:antitoxin HicB